MNITSLRGEKTVEGIELNNSEFYPAGLVLVSTGIRPQIDWIKKSGIHCERGILVDDGMHCSSPDVFACGDVAQWEGNVWGLWNPAVEQARVAGTNASGGEARFRGHLPITLLKCLGIPLVSMGDILEDGPDITSKTLEEAGSYKRIIFDNGIPVGAILLGTMQGLGDIRKLIESGTEVRGIKKTVLPQLESVGSRK